MRIYEVIARQATLHSGILKLTPKQYEPRRHAVKSLGSDFYEISQKVYFKKGEKFLYDGDINRALCQEIQEVPFPDTMSPKVPVDPALMQGTAPGMETSDESLELDTETAGEEIEKILLNPPLPTGETEPKKNKNKGV